MQHLFRDAFEDWRRDLSSFVLPTGESSETKIVTAGSLIA